MTVDTREQIKIQLFDEQFDAYHFDTQFGACIAGVQSGKTFVGSLWAGKKIQEFSGKMGVGVIVAPTYKILQQSTLMKLFQNFPHLEKYYKKGDNVIALPDGSKVFVRSADSPLGMEGITANWIWADEGGQFNLMAWTVLKSRVSMTRGQIFITTTPYNLGWLYSSFYMPWKNKTDKRLSVFSWASIRNPHFPVEHYESEKIALSPEEFKRRYMGGFSRMEGLVYDLPADAVITKEEFDEISKKVTWVDTIYGMDFGFHNPASIGVIKVDSDGIFYLIDEWYEAEKLDEEQIDALLDFKLKYKVMSAVYPDPADSERLELMKKKYKIPVKPVSKNVTLGIEQVRKMIRTGRFKIVNTCVNALDEFELYRYHETKDEVIKANDHLMDAIRYAIYNYLLKNNFGLHKKRNPNQSFGGVEPLYPELGIN